MLHKLLYFSRYYNYLLICIELLSNLQRLAIYKQGFFVFLSADVDLVLPPLGEGEKH